MQDRLKQYIDDHREEFEAYQPREYLWDSIKENLEHHKRSAMWRRLAIAASILLVVTCSTWLFVANRKDVSLAENAAQTQRPVMDPEVYFTTLVQMKDAELEHYCKRQPALCREFETDMESLSKDYYQLKNEYTASADKGKILKAMMTNLQTQLQLINLQLQIMKDAQKKKEEFRTVHT